MRATQRGEYVRVTVSRREVVAFKRTLPNSGLPDAAFWFDFRPELGLVDYGPPRLYGRYDCGPGLHNLAGLARQAYAQYERGRAAARAQPHAITPEA